MEQTIEQMLYQLEEQLGKGFDTQEEYDNYQVLKEQYEDETHDYSFSKREITGQLEIIMTTRENDFPNLDDVTRDDYLDLVNQLAIFDKGQADFYQNQLK